MKSLFLILILGMIAACGKSGGGGGDTPSARIEPIRIDCSSIVNRDSLVDYAVSAYKARKDCNLTEEEVVKFVQMTSM
jgi:hypothetical protein